MTKLLLAAVVISSLGTAAEAQVVIGNDQTQTTIMHDSTQIAIGAGIVAAQIIGGNTSSHPS